MKPQTPLKDRKYQRRQRAIALVIVLAMVSMMTIFMLAIFSVSRTEHTSSVKYADGQSAKELADSAVNIVMAQIWDGTQRTAALPAIWASQPGAIRRYNLDGTFQAGYRLYSSNQMQVQNAEIQMIGDAPPADWTAQNGVYTDLNEPVIRPDADGDGVPELIFPIIDPRAFVPAHAANQGGSNVEGFWYNAGFAGVVAANSLVDLNARLPMPVQWLYVLKNGMMGTMVGGGGTLTFQPATGGSENQPSVDNPIVGRVAFWTDDEACKININTAGEPTPWMVPSFIHERDFYFAHIQPMSHEYQRYPGHPATIAMSSVLFPNQPMDLYGLPPGSAGYQQILRRKERIYDVMPKLNFGGSKAGTVAFWRATDTNILGSNLEKSVLLNQSITERLYASVDELLFSQRLPGGGANSGRLLQDDPQVLGAFASESGQTGVVPIFSDPRQLERARFFLTAHSRVPEVNMYGMPRVAIWPVANETLGSEYRTGYDNLIAFCSSLGANQAARNNNSYYFRRQDYSSPTTDISISRNQQLLNMLINIFGRPMPGGSSFSSKYNQGDSTQILVQIFDYIRSTNLYDGFLAPPRQLLLGDGTPASGDPRYRTETYNTANNRQMYSGVSATPDGYADGAYYANKPPYTTYTPPRRTSSRNAGQAGNQRNERILEQSFPGHGSVVPSHYGNEFRGLGRFPTITEVGFHFICTADGNPDKGSFNIATRGQDNTDTKNIPWPGGVAAASMWNTNQPNFHGGRTAVKMDPHPRGTLGVGTARQLRATGNGPRIDGNGYLANERVFWYSNFPPMPRRIPGAYGTNPNQTDASHPSHPNNHPGFKQGNWNYTLPFYNANAGNLQQVSPLRPGMKRVQAQINLEICVPMVGYGPVHPEFSIEIRGLEALTLDGEALYSGLSTPPVWKSGLNVYHTADGTGTVTSGSYADSAALAYDRRVNIVNAPGTSFPRDTGYDAQASTSGNVHRGLRNYNFVSRFITIDTGSNGNPATEQNYRMRFDGGNLEIRIYAGHVLTPQNLVQVINIPPARGVDIPVPELVTVSTDHRDQPNAQGNRTTQRRIHAPEWWSFSRDGVFRQAGVNALDNFAPNVAHNAGDAVGGRFRSWASGNYGNDRVALNHRPNGSLGNIPRGTGLVFGYDPFSGNHNNPLLVPYNGFIRPDTGVAINILDDVIGDDVTDTRWSDRQGDYNDPGNVRDCRGQDVLFSIVPIHADVRHLLAKRVVPASEWMPHPKLNDLRNRNRKIYFAHNISRANSNANPGFDRGPNNTLLRLVPQATYNNARHPDVPSYRDSIDFAAKYGDFDNGPGNTRDGAWLNKPDEGHAGVSWISMNNPAGNPDTLRIPTAYFQEEDRGADAGFAYMTPNRMMPSPGMFGSLPSRVKGGEPWRTLLFRPNTPRVSFPRLNHPGAPGHQGGVDPADHYILDLFWMPVVEPYAISETFSSAGKVNINYQIVPFQHIRRATGIHAALKGELLAAIPNVDGLRYLDYPPAITVTRPENNPSQQAYHYRQPWTDLPDTPYTVANAQTGRKLWYRNIEAGIIAGTQVQGTLRQFESRFNHVGDIHTPTASHGLFRTASQICEVHLLPQIDRGNPLNDGGDATAGSYYGVADMKNTNVNAPAAFWAQRQLTGDNTRERPYTNLYGKISAQSNTFRVFYKAQTIRKARSVAPDQFDPARDRVTSEYRGSTLIERKLDANDPRLPDYAQNPNAQPLDAFYRFRVLETKRFVP